MNLQSFCTALGLTALTLSVITFPGFSQDNSSASPSNKARFFCNRMFDKASGEQIPMTVAWVPERQAHVLFIGWKSEAFPKWSPEKRCKVVSDKFQKFQEAGLLNYLTTGRIKGFPVICVAKDNQETCNGNNQLFTLKNASDSKLVLKQLSGIFEGTVGEPNYQSSGGQTYFNVRNYLQNAPVVNVEK